MLIFGARYGTDDLEQKIVKKAKYKTEKLFCSKTGKRLEDVKIQIAEEKIEYSLLGIKEESPYTLFCSLAKKYGLDYDYDGGYLLGFEVENHNFTTLEQLKDWETKLVSLGLTNIGLHVAYYESSY